MPRTKLDKDKAVMSLAVQVYTALLSSELETDDLQDMGQAVVNETAWQDLPAAVKVAMVRVADQIIASGNFEVYEGKDDDTRSNKGANTAHGESVSRPSDTSARAPGKGKSAHRHGRGPSHRADDGNPQRSDSSHGKDAGAETGDSPGVTK